jgi:hypothetical protein
VLKTVSLAVSLGTPTVPEAYLFTVLQGLATGGLDTLTAMLLADYYGRQHLEAIAWPAQNTYVRPPDPGTPLPP